MPSERFGVWRIEEVFIFVSGTKIENTIAPSAASPVKV
jgi:hypothetical protein